MKATKEQIEALKKFQLHLDAVLKSEDQCVYQIGNTLLMALELFRPSPERIELRKFCVENAIKWVSNVGGDALSTAKAFEKYILDMGNNEAK